MKKIVFLLMVCVLIISIIISVAPASAKNEQVLYESVLTDGPTPDILVYGKVTINSHYIVNVEFVTDQLNKTYRVGMEYGPAGSWGTELRRTIMLGNLTTDGKGKVEASFALSTPDPMIPGPNFTITSSSPMPDFMTSYGPMSPSTPPLTRKGRVVLNLQTIPATDTTFDFDLTYGSYCGYPAGLVMHDDVCIDSGFNVPPGNYSISEVLPEGWLLPDISIVDPSGGSSSDGVQTSINLAPGETVTVTYINTTQSQPPQPPEPTPGRIIFNNTVVSTSGSFTFNLSYGSYCGYPYGGSFNNINIDSGPLPPGTYHIDEVFPESMYLDWMDPLIMVQDPSGDSFSSFFDTTVVLEPGETVTVSYYNASRLLALPASSLVDQTNMTDTDNYGNSMGGGPGFLYQSFVPVYDNLVGVDLQVRPGGLFPFRGTTSLIMIKRGGVDGEIVGTSAGWVDTPQTLGYEVVVHFVFSNPITLIPGETYVIAWYSPGAPILTWMCQTFDSYSSGCALSPLGIAMPDTDLNFVTYYQP